MNEDSDPFDLDGKDIRRVIPQVRLNITRQRERMTAYFVSFLAFLLLGVAGFWTTGVARVFLISWLFFAPFSVNIQRPP